MQLGELDRLCFLSCGFLRLGTGTIWASDSASLSECWEARPKVDSEACWSTSRLKRVYFITVCGPRGVVSLSVIRLLLKPYFWSFRTIVSRMRAQNLIAGREWSKKWGEGLEQATTKMFDLGVSVLFRDATSPESPSSSWVRFPRALFKI